ncbi:MAG: phosphoribosyl-ATP diphosphatase [Deltaproteobacteria bacterium]|nr:phosphoribosyl-ATP diphosphatase [Deltaproteobacteria bacterium]MCB9788026.1 phosphoribosyl-ATP diphosphatase [Deltaproteobacteria bacterium]
MIVPSIDLMEGQAVQLIGGEKRAIDAGDPLPIARRFRLAGEVAVIDLDAALGQGSNRELIEALCREAACRVGGGIRDEETARRWLDAGARRIILGTAARPELLSRLPKERLIAALDARDGEVVVEGWRKGTGRGILERIAELREHVSGFLVTFVEREGRLGGTDMGRVQAIVEAAGPARVTIAGGVTTAAEIAELDRLGADAQVGMALYTGRLSLGEAIAAPLRTDRPDGLWATVICDVHGRALGLAWSNARSLARAVETGRGVYWSRSRGGLWTKGESSGATQELLAIDLDCDRDALRFVVRQAPPGFCHLDTTSCWGELGGLPALAETLRARAASAPPGSYTARLLGDPALLRAKLIEEAGELADATGPEHVAAEAADVLYFAMVALARAGVDLEAVERELDRRALGVTRRAGDAKPGALAGGGSGDG